MKELAIVVIDNDEPFRAALVESLHSHGYGARGFASAEEFIALYGPVDLPLDRGRP
jgi:FixJ family two-component response regulator